MGREGLFPARATRLAAFHAETEAILASPVGELPAEIFTNPR